MIFEFLLILEQYVTSRKPREGKYVRSYSIRQLVMCSERRGRITRRDCGIKISVRQATRLQTAINPSRQINGEMRPPGINRRASNRLRETERRVNDVGGEHPIASRNIAAARILTVQRGNEDGRGAGGVLLVVDAPHGENGCLVLPELRLDLGVEAVLLHEPGVEDPVDDGEHLIGARVQMRDVQPTGLDERDGAGDAELLEDGEVVDRGEEDGATFGVGGGSLVVEVENGELAESVAGEEIAAAVGEEFLQAVV